MFGKYVLWDSKNNYYWQKNIHFGYNFQNKEVLEARFTDKIKEATLVDWDEIPEIIDGMLAGTIIMGGAFKADVESLQRLGVEFISDEDMEYLKGTPAPLKITI